MKHYFILISVVVLCFIVTGCGVNSKEPSTGNELYIHEGYQEQLTKKGLKELQAFPYFSKPFITVAKDDQGVQFGVIYRDNNKVDVEKLPVNLEQIKQILENKGIDLSGPNGDKRATLDSVQDRSRSLLEW